MNKMIIALTAILSMSAIASTPSIGDTANYKLTAPAQPGVVIEIKSELIDYNATTDLFTKRSTMTVMGNSQEQDEMIKKDDISNFAQILEFCESDLVKGTFETITVAAGTMKTCKLGTEGATAYIADVPFGIVKAVSPEYTMELTSFTDL